MLICYAAQASVVVAGRLGLLGIRKGYYLYAGSALGPGGLQARLAHHMRRAPKPHWHIDYLRTVVSLRQIWFCYGRERREHDWADALERELGCAVPYAGFGSSDCGCKSHLFWLGKRPVLAAFDDAISGADPAHPPILWCDPR